MNERIRQLTAERDAYEASLTEYERRVQAGNLRARAERVESHGMSHYADHLRKRAAYLERTE